MGNEWKKEDWEAKKRKGPLPTGLIYDPTPFFSERPKEKIDPLMKDIDDIIPATVVALGDKRSALPMRIKIFEHLRLAAESGCTGETGDVEVGRLNLRSAKQELEDIGYDIRGRWFWTNTQILIGFLVCCGLPGAWLLICGLPADWLTTPKLADWTTAAERASTTPYTFPLLVCLIVACYGFHSVARQGCGSSAVCGQTRELMQRVMQSSDRQAIARGSTLRA